MPRCTRCDRPSFILPGTMCTACKEKTKSIWCEDCPSWDKRIALPYRSLCERCLRAALAEDHKDGKA